MFILFLYSCDFETFVHRLVERLCNFATEEDPIRIETFGITLSCCLMIWVNLISTALSQPWIGSRQPYFTCFDRISYNLKNRVLENSISLYSESHDSRGLFLHRKDSHSLFLSLSSVKDVHSSAITAYKAPRATTKWIARSDHTRETPTVNRGTIISW